MHMQSSSSAERQAIKERFAKAYDAASQPLVVGPEVRTRLSLAPGLYPPYVNSVHICETRDEQARLIVEGWGG